MTLIILGAVVLILIILLFLPITVDVSVKREMMLKIKYLGITLFDSEKRTSLKKSNNKKSKPDSKDNASTKKDNFIKKAYKQKGLLGTIDYFSEILSMIIKKLWRVVRRFKFRRFKLDIVVATTDAADTAIQYGKVCSAVYPVISLLQSITDFKSDSINISADFDKTKYEFKTSILVKTQVAYWLIAAVGALVQFLKIQRKEREKYERK